MERMTGSVDGGKNEGVGRWRAVAVKIDSEKVKE
jgi:hypothetical protein